ncbi:MAG: hypothetical protein QOC63_4766, partial [Mycobacterium sp.]|nr:hypothetical protein [Mycobacterium sp.]
HQEAIRRGTGTDAQRRPQRIALWTREPFEVIEHRRAQLMHPRERELHLRLDTSGTRHHTARRVLGHVIQQRRLTDTWLTTHDQRPTLTCADSLDQPVESLALASPAR